MTAATRFKIMNGQFGVAIVDTGAAGYLPTWRAPGGKTVKTATIADYAPSSTTWSCQITEFRLNATASTRTETIEDTICEPGQEVPIPLLSTWQLIGSMYQDLNVAAGLQQFAHDHDAEEVYIFCAFDGINPPKAIGRAYMAPVADTGGIARTSLKTAFQWPLNGSPQILYGDASAEAEVPASGPVAASGATAGSPGAWTPAGSTPPASVAALQASSIVAAPPTAWPTDDYVQTATAGAAGQAHWDGDSWESGAAP